MVEVAKDEGRRWLEKSLTAGFDVSAAVLAAAPFDHGRFHTFVPSDVPADQIKFPDAPDVPGSVADAGLARYLDDLTSQGASCVVVEDDVVERKDPALDRWTIPSAFVGDRIVHWFDLEPGSGTATVEAIGESAFGYPLNAFVITRSAADLGLVNGQPVAESFASQVAGSLLAVAVSAFDATSFAIWDRG